MFSLSSLGAFIPGITALVGVAYKYAQDVAKSQAVSIAKTELVNSAATALSDPQMKAKVVDAVSDKIASWHLMFLTSDMIHQAVGIAWDVVGEGITAAVNAPVPLQPQEVVASGLATISGMQIESPPTAVEIANEVVPALTPMLTSLFGKLTDSLTNPTPDVAAPVATPSAVAQ